MLKHLYSCDICRDPKQPIELWGIKFIGNKDFVISNCRSTDGIHICDPCLTLLRQLPLPASGLG